jgi:crotonobetainyl-CoA:carnitine CoA-transferase CaiB-like acyl-CoA transferase
MGGLMKLCGYPGRPPLMGPGNVAYRLASVHAAFGTLVALFNRRGTGCGDHVDVSLQDVLVSDPFLRVVTHYSVTGDILERLGHGQSSTVADTYKCKDGYVRIYVSQPDHWRRLLQWLGNPLELTDPKLEDVQSRFPLRSQIDRFVERQTSEMDAESLFEDFQAQRLAAAPINSPSAFLADKQTKYREYVVEVDHSHLERYRFPGDPYRFSESPWRVMRGAPRLDEHKEEVRREFSSPSRWSIGDVCGAPTATNSLLFKGIRVVSFPTGIVGPALASVLAQHGAEVISIEAGRVLRSPQRGKRWQLISDFESNHGKRRVAINMKHPEGQALAKQLIAKSDVVSENYAHA